MGEIGIEPKDQMRNGLNSQTKSFLKVSVFEAYTRVLHTTLVNTTNEQLGFHSVLYNPTLVFAKLTIF